MTYLAHRRKHFRTIWDLSGNTVAQYKCNDDAANTTVTDDGTGSTNGTASTNTSNLSVAGKINDCFEFTAISNEYADTNQTFQTILRSSFSLAFWIKPDDGQPANNNMIFSGQDNSHHSTIYVYVTTEGKIRFFYRVGGGGAEKGAKTNAAVFADGATSWTHVILTADGSNMKIYVNNSEQTLDATENGDMSGLTMGNYTTTHNPYFGANNDGNDSPKNCFDGLIDDFRIISKVISEDERAGIYNSGNGTEAQSG